MAPHVSSLAAMRICSWLAAKAAPCATACASAESAPLPPSDLRPPPRPAGEYSLLLWPLLVVEEAGKGMESAGGLAICLRYAAARSSAMGEGRCSSTLWLYYHYMGE